MKQRRSMTLFLALFLLISTLFPAAASAGEAQVFVRAQAENLFLLPPDTYTVEAGLAGQYGYTYGPQIGPEDVSALDVLVSLHETMFGEAFTPQDKDLYLKVDSAGYVTTIFGMETGNSGFAINGAQPHDSVWNEGSGGYPGYYIGYSLNQAKVENGDTLDYFLYQDEYALDYYTWFEQDGERAKTITVDADTDTLVTLKGYQMGWYGCSDEETITQQTAALEGCQIGMLNEGVFEPLSGLVTDENGEVTLRFSEPGTYILSAIGDEDEYADKIICPYLEIIVKSTAGYPQYTDEIPEDFENDLWLQYDFKKLEVGESVDLFPRRVPQINTDPIVNNVARPNFHFDLVEGDSVALSVSESTDKTTVTATKPGTSVVMVTYDSLDSEGTTYGASSVVNTAYAVFSVGEKGSVSISTDIPYTSYDTVYFQEGDHVDMPFHITAEGAKQLSVTCNGKAILPQDDGSYLAPLENRSNIIGIIAEDDSGEISSLYQVVDARKIAISIDNKTSSDGHYYVGDTVEISFDGITHPVYKLAQLYNPTFHSAMFGGSGTCVAYQIGDTEEMARGYCSQWDLATNNTITLQLEQPGSLMLQNGKIESEWWGTELGTDKISTVTGGAEASVQPTFKGDFSSLPDIELVVLPKDAAPVSAIELDREKAQMEVGDTLKLSYTIEPFNAYHQEVRFSSSDSEIAAVEQDGTITAKKEGSAVITATTADGGKTASCSIEVLKASSGGGGGQPSENQVTITVDKLTINKGYVLNTTTVAISSGDTVWDVTKKVLDQKEIDYTYSGTTSIYIDSIDGDGEFDHGSGSGWVYSVNGTFPSKGCNQYTLKSGDSIRWRYTLNYGEDVGGDNSSVSGGGSGGSGGGGGSSASSSATSTIEPSVENTEGMASAKVTASEMKKAVAAAKKEEIKQVLIRPKMQEESEGLTVEIPGDAMDSLVEETELTLRVDGGFAAVNLPYETLELLGEKDETITIQMRKVQTPLTAENGMAVEFSVLAGDEAVRGITATAEIFYSLQEEGESVQLYQIGDEENLPLDATYTPDSGKAAFEAQLPGTFALCAVEAPVFQDVAQDSWAKEYIDYLAQRGILTGKSENTFAPEDFITRAEFAAVLFRMSEKQAPEEEVFFDDVSESDWYYPAVCYAQSAGITKGVSDREFAPGELITREQMAVMLMRFAAYEDIQLPGEGKTVEFSDWQSISPYAQEAVTAMAQANIINGTDEQRFAPQDHATRAEAAKMLAGLMKKMNP